MIELPCKDADLLVYDKPNFKRVGLCLYRNDANGIYYGLIKKLGRQHRKSLKTTDHQLAKRRLEDFRRDVSRSRVPTKDKDTTFQELARDWFEVAKGRYKASSAESAENCLKQLNKYFGRHTVRNITARDLLEWEKARGAVVGASSFRVGHKDGGVLVAKTYGHLNDVHSAEMAQKMNFYVQ